MNEKIVNSIKKEVYEYIHTSIPAAVVDFNHVEMTATVQLLAKFKIRGIEQIPKAIYKVPVGHSKSSNFAERVPFKKGDIVFLSFSEVSLEKILSTGAAETVLGDSKFDLTDAVIITCISLQNNKLPDTNKDDWCLFNLNTNHKIVFKDNGDVEVLSKKISLHAEESIEINTPIINALESTLNIKAINSKNIITETFDATKSAIIKTIDFIKHIHSGVQGGSSNTGGPK